MDQTHLVLAWLANASKKILGKKIALFLGLGVCCDKILKRNRVV